MPLTWNAEKVQNWELLQSDDTEWQKTAYLCYELMRNSIGHIDEKNVVEVWTRIDMTQKLEGALLSGVVDNKSVQIPYSFEDIKRRIGYSTNVTTLTTQQWLKKFYKSHYETNEDYYHEELVA
jgi:hypothetical protein